MDRVHLLLSLKEILGADRVVDATEAQSLYPCCSHIQTPVLGAVSPETEDQVRDLVVWAGENDVKLYAISTGNNWGYGGGHPSAQNALIVYLGKMNRIISFDEERGIIDIEPGVSQQQLHDFLERQKHEYYTPVTGSSPTSSVLANALERGYGVTPITDHFSSILSVRAIMADGQVYQQEQEPDLLFTQGLFSQGNFGIVTSVRICLSPKSDAHAVIMFGIENPAEMESLARISNDIYTKAPHLVSSVKFFNMAYLVALNTEFPKDAWTKPDFDIEAWLGKEQKRQKSPMWMGALFISGAPAMVRKAVRQYKTEVRRHSAKIMIFTQGNVRILSYVRAIANLAPLSLMKPIVHKLDSLLSMFDLLKGKPQKRFLKAAYWKAGLFPELKSSTLPNPGRDGAGLMWFAPIVPFRGDSLLRLNGIVKDVCLKYGFFPVASVTTISTRSLSCLIPILFDPSTETEKAHACYAELLDKCGAAGFLPYRNHVNYLDSYTDRESRTYWKTISEMKKEIDPLRIISPGRYDGLGRNPQHRGNAS